MFWVFLQNSMGPTGQSRVHSFFSLTVKWTPHVRLSLTYIYPQNPTHAMVGGHHGRTKAPRSRRGPLPDPREAPSQIPTTPLPADPGDDSSRRWCLVGLNKDEDRVRNLGRHRRSRPYSQPTATARTSPLDPCSWQTTAAHRAHYTVPLQSSGGAAARGLSAGMRTTGVGEVQQEAARGELRQEAAAASSGKRRRRRGPTRGGPGLDGQARRCLVQYDHGSYSTTGSCHLTTKHVP
jgi:hypothetical protein